MTEAKKLIANLLIASQRYIAGVEQSAEYRELIRYIESLKERKCKKRESTKVKKGQLWQDWDCRFRNAKPRLIRVIEIHTPNCFVNGCFSHAICRNVDTAKKTKIKLRRFKPNSTGYKLIK